MNRFISLRNRILVALTLIGMVVLLDSCSKEPLPAPEVEKSRECDLLILRAESSYNPGLNFSGNATIGSEMVYLTLPENVDITTLKLFIQSSSKSTISINNTPFVSNSTSLNASSTLRVKITAEYGNTKEYKLLVNRGNSNIDNLLYNFMKIYSIPGVSVAISKDEQLVYSEGLGFAIKESEQRVVPTNLFRLASMSKQFTALCILKLYEDGKLQLDQTVFGQGGILESDFPSVSAKAAAVNVRHLLSHTSGWVSDPDPMFTSSFAGQTLKQRVSYMLTSAQSTPGTSFSYYNMGFGVLGLIIEKVSGKSYETYLKEVLAQSDITDIHVGGNYSQRRSNEVVYYSQSGTDGYGNDMQVIAAAGGVIASTQDLLKLAHHIDGYSEVVDIISSSTRQTMITPPFPSVYTRYALGWRLNHTYYPGALYHAGNLAGTATQWVVGGNLNVVVLCNSRSYISGFDDEMYGLLKNIRDMASGITNW